MAIEEPSELLIKEYLGGIGFLTRLLYDMVPKGLEKLRELNLDR